MVTVFSLAVTSETAPMTTSIIFPLRDPVVSVKLIEPLSTVTVAVGGIASAPPDREAD